MLIPFKNGMEIGMETTFNDLKQKHLKLVETQWKLREGLQDKAGVLLEEYADSLSLPAKTWTDAEGGERSYVEIGVLTAQGKFEAVPLPRLQMDNDYVLHFVIATTLDDTKMTGGYRHGVSISLQYSGPFLYASVGSGEDSTSFQVSSRPGGFFEVCGAIKQLINIGLERLTPTATRF